ncbi:MAG: HAMP domain-containing histidine kinase, partial [Immundisolibacteraceae bacterium]|nr:HAMP domain-containing histidine kinase [Immundisolibacteraceae bacterium]
KSADGKTMLMDIKSTLGQYKGEPAMVAFLRDVTAQHLAAEELRVHRDQLEELVGQKTDHLVHALELAETANRAKSRFLANISHELRTPLHAVLSYAEFGESKALDSEPEKLQQYFNRIHSSGKRLLLLLNDLLDLSQLEAGQLVLRPGQNNIQLLVEKVIDDLQLKIGDHQITINTTALKKTPIVICDFDRLCQVVSHLVSNALQFSADHAPVEISLSQDTKQTLVLIRDHGVGLIEAEIASLFTPFTESSRTRSEAGGTGLGLAISKQIIDMHKGTINGFNNRDGGATFYFTLPNQIENSGTK